ncbi:MAG TPA: hypothetical protein VLO29_08230, partial [Salegentibacter sp.]|nr:hypothetical protein [Salegentibacter sp.]
GNTRAVCRSYYVHPHIVKTYESGEILPYFNSVKKETKRNYTSLSETEKAVLKLIKDYEIIL